MNELREYTMERIEDLRAYEHNAKIHSDDQTDFCSTFYDPFAGSGTTLVACEGLGRTCYAMELDPKYCDVIIERWEELTGETAKKVN